MFSLARWPDRLMLGGAGFSGCFASGILATATTIAVGRLSAQVSCVSLDVICFSRCIRTIDLVKDFIGSDNMARMRKIFSLQCERLFLNLVP